VFLLPRFILNIMKNNKDILNVYKTVYKLPEITHKEQVNLDFFRLCREDYKFAIVCIYNEDKEFLLIRDLNKYIGWELVGGYIEKGENIEDSINRIVLNETGLAVDELQPILLINNIFKCGDKTISHKGITFIAQVRGNINPQPKNIKTIYTSKIPKVMAYQNTKVLEVASEIINKKTFSVPCEEIEIVKKFFIPYYLHRFFVKKIGRLASRKIRRKILSIISGSPESILDVSCGDDDFIFQLEKIYNPKTCIANDISWKTVLMMSAKRRASNILFTNHNVLELPLKEKFDLVVFKNTLHHVPADEQAGIIAKLLNISRQLIIVDFEDPEESGTLSRIWHWYYVHFLGDQGGNPLRFSKFKEIVQRNAQNATIETGIINTIKGEYFYASLLNMAKKEEVEVKVKVEESKVKDIKEKLLSMGAVLNEKVKETDIYFTAPHRDFIETKECLRIREKDGLTELTYKGPTNDAMKKKGQFWKPELNVSICSKRSDLESLLQFIDFKKVAEVIKDREKFTLGSQSVCMDKIEGVGWFLEVETITNKENRDEALKENMSLLNKLDMGESDIVDLPYRDLVINK